MGPAASLRSKWTTCFCVSPLKITQTCWLGSAEKLPPIMMIQLPCIHRCVSIGWAEGRLCLLDSSAQSAELLVAPQFCAFRFNFVSMKKGACLKISKPPERRTRLLVCLPKKVPNGRANGAVMCTLNWSDSPSQDLNLPVRLWPEQLSDWSHGSEVVWPRSPLSDLSCLTGLTFRTNP